MRLSLSAVARGDSSSNAAASCIITAPNAAYGVQLGEMVLKRCILNVLIMHIE